MKEGWGVKRLGEVCEVINGGTPKTRVPEYWDGQNRWITPAEMGKRLSPYVSETERKISDSGLRNSSAQMLPPQSVILSSRAPIGHLVINTEPMSTNQGCKGLIPNQNLDYKYLYFYLHSKVELLNSLGTGATFKELSGGKLKEVPIPLPPHPEQKRIVAILDDAFAGIATAKANAKKNLQNARAVFESHLNGVFSQRGDGWVEMRLGEICKVVNGGTPKTKVPEYWNGKFNWITPAEMGKRLSPYVSETERKISDSGLRNSSAQMLPPKSVILSSRAPIGHLVINTEPMSTNQGCKGLIPNSNLFYKYLFYYLRSRVELLNSLGTGATFKELSAGKLKEVPIPLPTLPEQKTIVTLLDVLSAETQRLATIYEHKLAALEALKKSLLHQAFTGEL